ncbi:MAG: nucleotidyltransferase family protein [Planctomycetia bacterium]|nr:nucleotidyltransferase family protein [Planctomycetia bacterium]
MLDSLVLRFFRDPFSCKDFTYPQWNTLFEEARFGKLLSRLAWIIQEYNLDEDVPSQAKWILKSAQLRFEHNRRQLFWELDRIYRAILPLETFYSSPYGQSPILLLKGAAYIAAGFPWAEGRSSVDMDVLVQRENLEEMERRLLEDGWLPSVKNEYDTRYYREWMHEIPPLCHIERKTVLDVHHNILPLTGRIKIRPELLWEQSLVLQEAVNPAARHYRILSPPDMILHSAVHLFQDGEISNAFRDLLDLDAMLRYYLPQAGFMERLFLRAEELGTQRSLFYAIHFCHQLLGTPISAEHLRHVNSYGGNLCQKMIMNCCVPISLLSYPKEAQSFRVSLANQVLYLRSHFLRMPLRMLIPHLWQKRRIRKQERKMKKEKM